MSKIVIVTALGKIIKFDSKSIREQSRGGRGMLGMRIDAENDRVVGIVAVEE